MPNRRAVLSAAALSPVLAVPFGAARSIAALQASPTAFQDPIEQEKAVIYGETDGQELLLDVYQPPLRDTTRHAVIVIHPGGFYEGDRSWMEEFARGLAEAGYVAFSISYRQYNAADETPLWPAPLIDAQRAVRWVRANAASYGVDPERVAAFGNSAGGLLALQLGMRDTLDNSDAELAEYSSRVDSVVSIVAATDAAIGWTFPGNADPQPAILGGSAEEVPEAYRDFTVLTHVTADAAPTLILHSSADTWTPVEHAWRLAEVFGEAGVEVVLCDLAGIEHPEWSWADAGPWTRAFLDRQFHPAQG